MGSTSAVLRLSFTVVQSWGAPQVGRQKVQASNYRILRSQAFDSWHQVSLVR